MKIKQYLYLLFFLFFIGSNFIYAQGQKRIQIEYAGDLVIDEEKHPGAKILTRDDSGQVHIIHEGVNMWCDQAIHYGSEDFIEAYGNVKMKQGDTINMNAKYVESSFYTAFKKFTDKTPVEYKRSVRNN